MNPQFTITTSLIKRVVGGLLALVLLVLAVNYLLTHSLLVVNAQGKGSAEMTVTVTGAKNTKPVVAKLASNGTKNLWLPTDEYTINLSQDHRSTLAVSPVRALSSHKVTVTLQDEAASTRLAGQSPGCGTISGGTYYSYECYQPSQIYRQTAGGKEPISDSLYDSVTPVGTNFIASLNGEENDLALFYVDPASGQQTELALPQGLPGAPQGVVVVPNQAPGATYQFALVVTATNTWYLYHNPTDQSPAKVEAGSPGSGATVFAGQLSGDQLVSYFNTSTTEGSNPTTPGELWVYSLATKQPTSKAKLPAGLNIDSATLVGTGTAAAQISDGGLAIFTLNKDSLKLTATITNAKNFNMSGGHALFSRDSGVYELHADSQGAVTANRLYSGDGFTYASLGVSGTNVIMGIFTGQASQQASGVPMAYGLDLTKPASYPRPEWSLAVAPSSNDQTAKPASIVYTGLNDLVDRGMSTYQTDDLRYALAQYYKSAGKTLQLAAVDTNTINKTPHDRNSTDTRERVSFTVKLNDETLTAQVEYFDISGLRIRLSNAAGAQVYDSGDIDVSK